MKLDRKEMERILDRSVQINDGLTQTSGDGAGLVFDPKYGIVFCTYMPGFQGNYGESRSRISLSYFPASQPTNIRFVDIAEGHDEYCQNIWGLGDGKVRVIYEKNSRADGDHPVCYRDYDFRSGELSTEQQMQVRQEDGSIVPLNLSVMFTYLEKHGYHNHVYCATEQIIIGGCTFFRGDDGYTYGALVSMLSEVVLFRSQDDLATIEFFAVYPLQVQYEFSYLMQNGMLHAIYRTDREEDAISYVTSQDFGKTWSEPVNLPESIQCRPRIRLSNDRVVLAYNVLNNDTGNRPSVSLGRTSVKFCMIGQDTAQMQELALLYSKCGIVNIDFIDILGDLYLAYSTSELALEYQNGLTYGAGRIVRGKDAVRYVKLGALAWEAPA